jgi:hypothetical protein
MKTNKFKFGDVLTFSGQEIFVIEDYGCCGVIAMDGKVYGGWYWQIGEIKCEFVRNSTDKELENLHVLVD